MNVRRAESHDPHLPKLQKRSKTMPLIPFENDFIDTDILDKQLSCDAVRCYVAWLKEQIKSRDELIGMLKKRVSKK